MLADVLWSQAEPEPEFVGKGIQVPHKTLVRRALAKEPAQACCKGRERQIALIVVKQDLSLSVNAAGLIQGVLDSLRRRSDLSYERSSY